MRTLQLKKSEKLNCTCVSCGKSFQDALTVSVSQRFLSEGEQPPRGALLGKPDAADLSARSEEEARRLATIALRQETELLIRRVNEQGDVSHLKPEGGTVCPHCGKPQPWLTSPKAGGIGAAAGAVLGIIATVLLCVFWLKRPDIIIAIGLCGCLGYAGNRAALSLEAKRVQKAVQKLTEAQRPKIVRAPSAEE